MPTTFHMLSMSEARVTQERVLVLGAAGILGWNLLRANESFIGTIHKSPVEDLSNQIYRLDVSSRSDFVKLIDNLSPSLVINCTGMTDIEICESRPEAAYALNTVAPRMIAEECATRGLRFFQLSTDHFQSATDEINDRTEVTQFEATNQYALTKLFMERQVLLTNPKALVIRTNFFGYSPSSKSFFSQLVTSDSDDTFTGYRDVFFNPLGVTTLVQLLTAMSKIELTGLVHAVSSDVISKLDFAKRVLDASKASASLVSGLLPRSYPKRPHFLALQPTESLRSLLKVGSIEDMIGTEANRFPPSQKVSTNEAKRSHRDRL